MGRHRFWTTQTAPEPGLHRGLSHGVGRFPAPSLPPDNSPGLNAQVPRASLSSKTSAPQGLTTQPSWGICAPPISARPPRPAPCLVRRQLPPLLLQPDLRDGCPLPPSRAALPRCQPVLVSQAVLVSARTASPPRAAVCFQLGASLLPVSVGVAAMRRLDGGGEAHRVTSESGSFSSESRICRLVAAGP